MPVIELPNRPKTLEEIRAGKESISPERWQELYDATQSLSVEKDNWGAGCTATVINNEVMVTAAHCLNPNIKEYQTLTVSLESPSNKHAKPSSWKFGPIVSYGNDTTYAHVIPTGIRPTNTLMVPVFGEGTPEQGTQFFAATLPGDSISPVPLSATFLGVDPDNGRWQLLINPETDPDSNAKACALGSSGSLFTDIFGHITVLNGSARLDGSKPEDKKVNDDYFKYILGVDTSTMEGYITCAVTPLSAQNAGAAVEMAIG